LWWITSQTLMVRSSLAEELNDAYIVTIVCDRGDRYLSTEVFPSQ